MKFLAGSSSAAVLLRIGLGVVFLYAAISAFKSPNDWVGYLPHFARNLIPADQLLHIFSAYEFALACWLFAGWRTRYAALLAALTFAGIVVANPTLFMITFRDIALCFAALALFSLDSGGK